MTAPTERRGQVARVATRVAICMKYTSQLGRSGIRGSLWKTATCSRYSFLPTIKVMAWTLRWPLWQRCQAKERRIAGNWLPLTVGVNSETRHIDLSPKDVWQLRNGSTILRDGLLVVPENGKLRFLL